MAFQCYFGLPDGAPSTHTHETIAEMRTAHAPVSAPVAPPVTPSASPAAVAPSRPAGALWEPVTDRQRDYAVNTLGLDAHAADILGKRALSAWIDVHKGHKPLSVALNELHGHVTKIARVGAPPAAVAPPLAEVEKPKGIPDGMIDLIRDGRYATRTDPAQPFLFYKVTRPSHGQFKGALKISTRHGDEWRTAWVRWPSGRVSVYRFGIEDHLLELIPNQELAKHRYAREVGQCCICGKGLTDERSRYYGIGPDCETRHQAQIDWVEMEYDPYVPGKGFSSEEDR